MIDSVQLPNMISPPGIIYIAQNVPFLLAPLALFYGISVVIQIHLTVQLPKWIIVVAFLLSHPFHLFATTLYTDYVNARTVAAYGATFPPRVESRLPFGLSNLRIMVTNFKKGYSGKFISSFKFSESDPVHSHRWYTHGMVQTLRTYLQPKDFVRGQGMITIGPHFA
jgi:hypothetical protein